MPGAARSPRWARPSRRRSRSRPPISAKIGERHRRYRPVQGSAETNTERQIRAPRGCPSARNQESLLRQQRAPAGRPRARAAPRRGGDALARAGLGRLWESDSKRLFHAASASSSLRRARAPCSRALPCWRAQALPHSSLGRRKASGCTGLRSDPRADPERGRRRARRAQVYIMYNTDVNYISALCQAFEPAGAASLGHGRRSTRSWATRTSGRWAGPSTTVTESTRPSRRPGPCPPPSSPTSTMPSPTATMPPASPTATMWSSIGRGLCALDGLLRLRKP